MRRAFTLLELIVVIIIIAVLIALIVPAVCNVRKAAVRASCANNLKQLGIAVLNYHDVNKHFPPGTVSDTTLPPDERLSFYASLLPYIECGSIYSKLHLAEPWDSEANREAVGTGYGGRFLTCPDWIGERGQATGANAATGHLIVTNYVGVAGIGLDAATRPADSPGIGMFGYDRTLKLEDVKDGTSNTMLLTETGNDVGPWMRGGATTVRCIDPSAGQLTGDGLPFGGTHFLGATLFKPKRAEGFHILLADATVRYTQNSIHPDVLMALATVAGGEEIPAGW